MSKEDKRPRGGIRSTLALLLSIAALTLSIISLSRTEGQEKLREQLAELRVKVEKASESGTEQVARFREEFSGVVERMKGILKKEDQEEEKE